jgi:valyl-tRNA synthetase
MATNSGRGNPIAAADGPPIQNTATPPHVSETLKSEMRQEAKIRETLGISTGLHAAGQDADAAPPGAHVETVDEAVGQGREGSNS